MKRFYTLLILFLGVLSSLMATDEYGFFYSLDKTNKTAKVSGTNCVKEVVEIPGSIIVEGVSYKITSIGWNAFRECKELTSITIGSNVTKIDAGAFNDCSNLESITIPNSLTTLDHTLFKGCSSLTKVNYLGTMEEWLKADIRIPTSFDLYLNGVLQTNVNISSTDSIRKDAFRNCKSIKSVEISGSVTSIGLDAFLGCTALTSITIPNSVTFIDAGAFTNCSSLTKVNYLGSVDEWLDINFTYSNNNPTVYAKDLYINGKLLTDVKISSADSIKDFAICFCKSIKSVEIGNSVAYIDKNAFSGCSGLTSVTWNIKNYPGFRIEYESPFDGLNITSFTFGNEVERVPAYICDGQKSLKEVTIGTNVISIGHDAFEDCFALTSVIWNAKNCQDGGPFYPSGAKNVTLVLGTEVEHIPQNLCFDNFSKVNYLGSVNKWVDFDFNSQGSNPTYYTKDLYINGELLTDVKISSADSIKKYAFHNCKSIKSLEIGKSVTFIGESAFSGCSGLVKVNYLGSVDKWAQINFASLYANPTNNTNDLYINDELLTEVRISSADNIKKYAFYNCKSLKNVEMSDTLTTVDEYAFYNCSDLTSVSIGKGVTIIGNNAFNNCSRLNTIVSYPTAVPTAYNNSFKNYNATLYVPCDAYDNYSADDVFGQFKVINCITAGEEGGTTPTPTPTPNPDPKPEPDPTPDGEVTLYYVNKTGWSAVNAYVWDDASGTPIVAWSGEPATKLDKTVDGNEVYSYTFDSSLADRIIFNNSNGGEGNQTDDLTFEASKPYFYNGVWYETLTFDTNGGGTVDPNPTPDPEPEPDPTPDPNVAPLYVKGGFNNWEVNDTYKLTSADGNYYVANYSAGNEITISGNFKISNEDWSVNYGGGFLIEAGKSYTLTAGGANLDTAGKIKASKVEFTQSTGVLKITGTTSSNEFDTTKDQGVAFVVNPRGTSLVYVPLTYSYNAESQTAQYTGTYTVTELGVTAKIGGLTNFNVIDYGTNGQPVMPKLIYDMVKGAYDGFTIEGDYKVGDVLNILVLFDKDWNSSILINVQEAGTNPTPDPKPEPEPEPTPDGEITLYYVNKTGWSAVNAYVWDDASGTPIVAWSGEPATKLDKTVDAYKVYSYTFDSSLADRIIFNNGNGGVGNQTDDLTFEASKPYFYDGVWYETLTFDTNGGGTVDPNPTPEPEPDPAEPAFIVAGNGGSDATGIWCSGIEWNPSAEANKMKDADKDGIFEITYSNVPAGTWSFKVVAHDGGTFWLGGFFLDTENSSNGVTAVSDDGNINFTLNAPANVTVKFNTTISRIIITTPSGNFGKVTIDYFSVANTDECLVENRFTAANNNTLKYTENIQILEGNEYGYAVYRILGNCNYAVYEKNLYVEVTEAGIYDITIVFNGDYENPDFTVTAVKQGGTTGPDTPEDPDTPDDDINVSVEEVSAIMIYAKEGTVYSEVDFEIYDLVGVNVTKLNGSLQGVYIVKTAEGNRLISVW